MQTFYNVIYISQPVIICYYDIINIIISLSVNTMNIFWYKHFSTINQNVNMPFKIHSIDIL